MKEIQLRTETFRTEALLNMFCHCQAKYHIRSRIESNFYIRD